MDYKEFEVEFKKACLRENIAVKNRKKFYDYMKLLLEWNKKINLTAITDEKMFLEEHFVDSLTITDFVEPKSKIIDIGTGGGFPGVPLKLYDDTLDVTLVDSKNKKIKVVNDIIKKLDLKRINAICERAEILISKDGFKESFDVATSRAVSNMSTLSKYMLPFIKVGGIAICMKGPNYKDELNDAKDVIKTLGGKIDLVKEITLNGNIKRTIIIIKKIK